MKTKTLNTNRFIKLSLLSAIAVILMYIDFPVIPIFPWLKIDLSDVPALMGAFAFGPLAGVIITLCKENNINSLTLEVRESNIPAQSLYKKHGFKEEGIRKNFYNNPKENAIIMWRHDI